MPGGTSGDEAVKHVGKRRVRIAGRFFPNGAGAIDNKTNVGKKGWTVARSGVGLYTLTLDRRWMKLVPVGLTLQLSAAADVTLQWGTFTPNDQAGTWAVQIRALTAAAAAEIAANANNSIGFELEAVQDTVAG